jgi:hypothetical protein
LRISSRTGKTATPLFLSSPIVFASFTLTGLPYINVLVSDAAKK